MPAHQFHGWPRKKAMTWKGQLCTEKPAHIIPRSHAVFFSTSQVLTSLIPAPTCSIVVSAYAFHQTDSHERQQRHLVWLSRQFESTSSRNPLTHPKAHLFPQIRSSATSLVTRVLYGHESTVSTVALRSPPFNGWRASESSLCLFLRLHGLPAGPPLLLAFPARYGPQPWCFSSNAGSPLPWHWTFVPPRLPVPCRGVHNFHVYLLHFSVLAAGERIYVLPFYIITLSVMIVSKFLGLQQPKI